MFFSSGFSFHSQINMMFPELDLLDCNPGLPESKHTGEIQIYFYSLWQMLFETWLVRTEVQWMCFTFVLLTDRGQMTQCKDPQLSDKRKTCVPESSLPLTIALWLWACPPTSPRFRIEKKDVLSGTAWAVERIWYISARESWFCPYCLGDH